MKSEDAPRRRWLALVGLGSLVVVVLAAVAFILGPAQVRAELEEEFTGAYPEDPAGGGETMDVSLVASEATVQLTDGEPTTVWAYNSTVPGPHIEVALGDTVRVELLNDLHEPTTIHWHGIRVPNDMDGVPHVNQQPVEPGDTFAYEFTPPDAGTYWYHSHTNGSEQLERGLYGTIVVTDPANDAGFDQDLVWVVDDWQLDDDDQLVPEFNTSNDRVNNGRWGDVITVNSSTDFTVEARPGERIRVRLVNAANGRTFEPDFGVVEARVIAVDGLRVATDPGVSAMVLAPGNRVDVDLVSPQEPGDYVVMDARDAGRPLATLRVSGGPVRAADEDLSTNASIPEWDAALDLTSDLELVFETRLEGEEWVWTINGAVWGEHEPIELEAGTFTKIRLVNNTHPTHPIHLHGQFFKVLTRNGEPVNEPNWRDTVLLERLDIVEIGLVPLDEGTWVLHCHIQEHAEAGMMTTVIVAEG